MARTTKRPQAVGCGPPFRASPQPTGVIEETAMKDTIRSKPSAGSSPPTAGRMKTPSGKPGAEGAPLPDEPRIKDTRGKSAAGLASPGNGQARDAPTDPGE